MTLLSAKPVVINVGLSMFGDSLIDQGVRVLQVVWRPPAGGDAKLIDLLDTLRPMDDRSDSNEG